MYRPIEQLRRNVIKSLINGRRPLIKGEMGVGKTFLVGSIAKEMNLVLQTLIGGMCDPTDVNGYPVVEDYDAVDASGRATKVIAFAVRKWLRDFNEKHGGRGMLFLDEYTGTKPATQGAMQTSVQSCRFGDYQMDPYKFYIIGACNPADLATDGQELSLPAANRFAHFTFPCDTTAALEWANNFGSYWGSPPRAGMDGHVIDEAFMIQARAAVAGFIIRMPTWWHYTLKAAESSGDKKRAHDAEDFAGGTVGIATARTWEGVAVNLGRCLADGDSPYTIQELVASEVGAAAAADFQTYLQSTSIPDPEDVLRNAAGYRPSGRVDVDFVVMSGVVAAVEGNLNPDRLLAAMTVCNAVTKHRGSYEAGAVAVGRLAKFMHEKAMKTMAGAHKLKPEALSKLQQDLYKMYKPYQSITNISAPLGD